MLAHEFIHVDLSDKYGDHLIYSFLHPEDFAFMYLMEEAFARTMDIWVRLAYPEHSDHNIRNYMNQARPTTIADAMRNDLKATTNMSEEEIIQAVLGEIFNVQMTFAGPYSLQHTPSMMAWAYGNRNTMLISQYEAYRPYGDRLNRHMWNYLSSILPVELPEHMTYDHFRSQFSNNVTWWATNSTTPNNTILHWINFDAAGAARDRLASLPENQRDYHYLSLEDEQRLNRIILEIDPFFTPVNTSNSHNPQQPPRLQIPRPEEQQPLQLPQWPQQQPLQLPQWPPGNNSR